jgi:hypothetical protein
MTRHRTSRWIDALHDIVSSYSRSDHRSIGMVPIDVTPADKEDEIAERLYRPKPLLRYK